MNTPATVTARKRPKSLPELCSDLFVVAIQLKRDAEPESSARLSEHLTRLFAQFEERAKTAGHSNDEIEAAKFALVSLLDELIRGSGWSLCEDWAQRPLQRVHFETDRAGTLFYDRLQEVRKGGSTQVLEVYLTCLTLGFRGRLHDAAARDDLRKITADVGREVLEARGATPELSPSWRPTGVLATKFRRLPIWLVPVICAAGLLIWWVSLSHEKRALVRQATQDTRLSED
ncbi:MAG: DotU family type IV/VI secretion system protein [Planctomycetota bacterium]